MKKFNYLLGILTLFILLSFTSVLRAQNGPAMYFCEKYTSSGEQEISDRFYTGRVTVMVKCDYELGLKDVTIQFDKYNCTTKGFEYNKKVDFSVKPSMKYIYFDDPDLKISAPGIYRCFLLDENRKTVASALIEFIE